jgi:hypothetical protein
MALECDIVVLQVDYLAFGKTARRTTKTKCDSVVLQVDYLAFGAKGGQGRGKGLGRRDGDSQANGEIGLCNPTGEAVVAGGSPMFENLFNKNSGWIENPLLSCLGDL